MAHNSDDAMQDEVKESFASSTDPDHPRSSEGEEDEDEDEEEEEEDAYDSDQSCSSQETDDPQVIEEINEFLNSYPGLNQRYKLITKIGEGTFSSVYKAVDLLHHRYINDWDIDAEPEARWQSPPLSKRAKLDPGSSDAPAKYVAIKKIYVTSSPARIQNELELLKDLSGSNKVVALITAFRHQDQVIAVMPYFKHVDFRDYFRVFRVPEMKIYFRQLFAGMDHVHKRGILHRDIKPTNFLYDVRKGRGVLVDFGLAEREDNSGRCPCIAAQRREKIQGISTVPAGGYPKNDQRPARRANRAGTRGFRAPEVLFKCAAQTTEIDIWSAGVILLTFLSRRFPFFNSADDIDATIEIATMFGRSRMRNCAALHGVTFECNIGTIGENGFTLEKIVHWATSRKEKHLPADEQLAVKFLGRCLELDPLKRISAEDALRHEFLLETTQGDSDEEIELVTQAEINV